MKTSATTTPSTKRHLDDPTKRDDMLPRKTGKSSPDTATPAAAAAAAAAATTDTPLASLKGASMNPTETRAGMSLVKSYSLTDGIQLVLLSGSVTDFEPTVSPSHPDGAADQQKKTFPPAAIVNAANKVCLGGAGVDGAISKAGGIALFEDRERLPVLGIERYLKRYQGQVYEFCDEVRVLTGDAAMTGPGLYGDLKVSYVIHAVGPDFRMLKGKEAEGLVLLKQAYWKSLAIASRAGLKEICFPALSAGIFRGYKVELEEALAAGVQAIKLYCETVKETSLKAIYLCAFQDEEAEEWARVCSSIVLGIKPEPRSEASIKLGIQNKLNKKKPPGQAKNSMSNWLQGRKSAPNETKEVWDEKSF